MYHTVSMFSAEEELETVIAVYTRIQSLLSLKSADEEKQWCHIIGAGCLILVPQPELPPSLQIQPGYLSHQRLAVLGHETQRGPRHKVELLQVLAGEFLLAEVQQQAAESNLAQVLQWKGRGLAFCYGTTKWTSEGARRKLAILLGGTFHSEHFRLDEADVCLRSQADVVVDGKDRKLRALGVREESLSFEEEIMFHQVRSGVGEVTGRVVMQGDNQFVDFRTQACDV